MMVPPGIAFLVPTLPYLLAPAVAVYTASNIIRSSFDVVIPTWILVTTYVLLWPFAITFYAYWRQYRILQRAAAAGAELPPMVESKLPGGIDLVRKAARDWHAHFNGADIRPSIFFLTPVLSTPRYQDTV